MSEWNGWEFGRVAVAFSALMYLGIWVQVSLFHRAGAFKHPAMWWPVTLTPLLSGGALAAVATRGGAWGWIGALLLALGVVNGMAGMFFHLRGVAYQVGGFTVRNFLSGPPAVLPLAYSLVGTLGLMGLLWNA